MDIKFLKRSFFQRLLGISATAKPEIDDCWNYANGKLTIDLSKASELRAPGGAARIRLEGVSGAMDAAADTFPSDTDRALVSVLGAELYCHPGDGALVLSVPVHIGA